MNDSLWDPQVLIHVFLAAALVLILWTFYEKGSPEEQRKKRPPRSRYMHDEMPPVFPNGWIPVLLSSELKINEVKSMNVVGEELVVFRTQDGVAHIMDAYCPHLGANLGAMGRVVGDCIECPFHGWRFRGEDGVCTDVPYASKPPAFVKAKTWISKEVYGLLLAWYHADGEKPTWDVNEPDEITSGRWRRAALYEKQIHGIMQDIAENGADVNHFSHVHKSSAFAGPKEYERVASTFWLRRAMTFEFDVKWSEHDFKLGPALTVAQTTSPFGNLFYVFSLTPRGPLDICSIIQTYDDRSVFWPIRRLMESATSTIVDQDTLIWDHKTFLKNPGLVKQDSAIKTFREWYAQFYSSKSLTWRDVREKTLVW